MHWSCRASHLRPETVCDRMRKENRAELCMTQKRLSMRVARLECKNSSTRTLARDGELENKEARHHSNDDHMLAKRFLNEPWTEDEGVLAWQARLRVARASK
jgi:hypothetical protein